MKIWLYLFSLVLLSIVMVGCSESEVDTKFHKDVTEYITKYTDVIESVENIYESEKAMSTVIASKSYVDAVGDMALFFNQEVKTIEILPTSKTEKEIAKTLEELNALQSDYIDELWYKLENSLYDEETELSYKRGKLETTFKRLKEEIEYVE